MVFTKIENLKIRMQEVIDFFKQELAKIHTGRANSALIENFKVSYYGQEVLLKTVASISVPEANLIVVQPWDKETISEIENSLRNSELGFNISNDGTIIRLSVPAMSSERREEMIKLVENIAEENKVKLRNLRREVWGEIQSEEQKGIISEDDKYDAQKELQELIEEFEKKINQELEKKKKEIKEV